MKLEPKKDIRDLMRFNKIMLILTQQGFGYLFAIDLARKGYQVAATSRALKRMQQLKDQAQNE